MPRAIAFARAFPGPPGLRFEGGRIADSPAQGHDVAVAMEVLEHIPNGALPGVVDALRNRVAASGRLVVTVPTVNVPLSPKDERHYTVDLLDEHLAGGFTRESVRYLNRVSRAGVLVDRLAANRWFALRHAGLLRVLTKAYRARALHAASADGANLLAVYRPS